MTNWGNLWLLSLTEHRKRMPEAPVRSQLQMNCWSSIGQSLLYIQAWEYSCGFSSTYFSFSAACGAFLQIHFQAVVSSSAHAAWLHDHLSFRNLHKCRHSLSAERLPRSAQISGTASIHKHVHCIDRFQANRDTATCCWEVHTVKGEMLCSWLQRCGSQKQRTLAQRSLPVCVLDETTPL